MCGYFLEMKRQPQFIKTGRPVMDFWSTVKEGHSTDDFITHQKEWGKVIKSPVRFDLRSTMAFVLSSVCAKTNKKL